MTKVTFTTLVDKVYRTMYDDMVHLPALSPERRTPMDWQEGFRKAVISFVLEKGELMSEGDGKAAVKEAATQWPSYFSYGWFDYTAEKHRQVCGVTATEESEMKEMSFSKFDNTFDGNTESSGFIVTEVNCACGELKHRVMVWEGTLEEAIRGVLL